MLTERISDVKFATTPPFRPPPNKYTEINTYTCKDYPVDYCITRIIQRVFGW